MRTSLSRRRHSKNEMGSVSSISTMPRLLADDESVESSLPSTSPMSQAARRNIRAQLFGMDSDLQSNDVRPSTRAHDSTSAAVSNDEVAKEAFDVRAALAILHEFRKSATTDELTAMKRALDTQVDHDASEAAFRHTGAQRTLSRRKSVFKPGEATRPKTSTPTKQENQTDRSSPVFRLQYSISSQTSSLNIPARPPLERAITPGDLERAFLGIHTIGSLRITNVTTPSPSPRPLEATACIVSPIESEKDYFTAINQSPENDAQQPPISPTIRGAGFPALGTVSNEEEKDFVMTEDAFVNLLETSPTIVVQAKPRDRSSTVLVGHRRFAQQRGNTAELCFEDATIPVSTSSQVVVTETPKTEHEAAKKLEELQGEYQADMHTSQVCSPQRISDVFPTMSSEGSSSNTSPRQALAIPIISARPSLKPYDSAYNSGASCESSLRSASPDKVWRGDDDNTLQRMDSLESVYTIYDNTSSETVKQHQEEVTTPLAILQQPGSSTSSSSSVLHIPPRIHSYDGSTQRPPPVSSLSTSSLPSPTTLPHQHRKLQKKRFVTDKPADNIIVQGRLTDTFRNLPDLPQDIISAHASRLNNNPGMDHLTETHCQNKRSSVYDDTTSNDESIPQTQELRFPSPTPTEEIDARHLASPPRNHTSHHSSTLPAPPPRSKSIFRSMSRSGRKSNTPRKEPTPTHNEVLITVADLGDVVGVLGASPYDIAVRSNPSSSGSNARRSAEGGRQVLQPCQIGYMENLNMREVKGKKSMSAEEATASAMRRSCDRLESSAMMQASASPERNVRGRGKGRYVTPPPPVPQLPRQAQLQQKEEDAGLRTLSAGEVPVSGVASAQSMTAGGSPTPMPSRSTIPPPPPPPPTAWSTSQTALHTRNTTPTHASTFPSTLIPSIPSFTPTNTNTSTTSPTQHKRHSTTSPTHPIHNTNLTTRGNSHNTKLTTHGNDNIHRRRRSSSSSRRRRGGRTGSTSDSGTTTDHHHHHHHAYRVWNSAATLTLRAGAFDGREQKRVEEIGIVIMLRPHHTAEHKSGQGETRHMHTGDA